MKSYTLFTAVAAIALLALPCLAAVPSADELTPGQALEAFDTQVTKRSSEFKTEELYNSISKEIADSLLEKVIKTDLEPAERFDYATLLEHAQRKQEAMEIYRSIASENSVTGRKASVKVMSAIDADTETKKLEAALSDYFARFPKATHEFKESVYEPLFDLFNHYVETGEFERAIGVLEKELKRIEPETAYSSWFLFASASEAYRGAGRLAEYQQALSQACDTFAAKLDEVDPDDKASFYRWRALKGQAEAALTHSYLLDKPAPEITFTKHFYNSEPFTLEDLKGKVVMIDFFANWCGPCKMAFPKMRELYDEYKEQGLEIVGVTSFQGNFYDGDIAEKEVDQERELELTAEFLNNHGITWPVAFSEARVFNPDYGVNSIPTIVLLDREGRVTLIQAGFTEEIEQKIRAEVIELLNE